MRGIGWWLAAGGLALGLGCSGLTEAGKKFTDANLEVAEGPAAKLPDGFPLPAPAGGTLITFVSAGLMGTQTRSAVYELAAGADVDAALAPYRAVMEGAGMTVSTQTSDATHVVSGVKDQTTWTVTATPQDGEVVVTLTVATMGT